MDSEEYAHNLKTYFGCANSVHTLTLADLSFGLTGISSANQLESVEASVSPSVTDEEKSHNMPFSEGHHVACVWEDDRFFSHDLKWYISVVERITDGGANMCHICPKWEVIQ